MQRKFGPERHNGRSDTLVVVPAFNEQNNIICVLREIQTSLPEADILVINDCSHDDTAAIARSVEGVAVVDLPCNLGVGGAMQAGFKYALASSYDYVLSDDFAKGLVLPIVIQPDSKKGEVEAHGEMQE